MRVTVCELPEDRTAFEIAFRRLRDHVEQERSEFVLIPECPFSSWFATTPTFETTRWQQAIEAHEQWERAQLTSFRVPVAYTRPSDTDAGRRNVGSVYAEGRTTARHEKVFLPDIEPVYEASWYGAGTNGFTPFPLGKALAAFVICTELWFFENSRHLGHAGAQLLLTPRKTDSEAVDRWLLAGRIAAITAGAFSLSSNTVSQKNAAIDFGGTGWIIDPSGNILATTSREEPFVTRELKLADASAARLSYPRNVPERP